MLDFYVANVVNIDAFFDIVTCVDYAGFVVKSFVVGFIVGVEVKYFTIIISYNIYDFLLSL